MPDLGPGVIIVVIAVAVACVKIFRGPIGEAIAERLRRGGATGYSATQTELDELKSRVAELEERLDFSERLLADGRQVYPSPGRAHR